MASFRFIIWLPVLLAEECQVDFLQRKVAVEAASTRPGIKRTYGKYHTSDGDDYDNSLWVYYPLKTSSVKKRPVVVFFHMGGFVDESPEPIDVSSDESDLYNEKDVVYVTVGYRLLATRYYYTAHNGSEHLEEQVYIQSDGRLDVDPDTTYEKFKPRIDLSEHYPKSFYDAVQAFDYVISHADEFGIDAHQVILSAVSAGSGISNYIALIHQSSNLEHFTIKAMTFVTPQLNYPLNPRLDMGWKELANFVGREAPLGSYIDKDSCPCVIGSALCSACTDIQQPLPPIPEAKSELLEYDTISASSKVKPYPYLSCNESWNALRIEKFCEKGRFVDYTIGDVLDFQSWPESEGSLAARLPLLWYAERNYEALRPNFSIILSSALNGTSAMDMAHHTLNVANYARLARKLGVPFVAYYSSWPGMTEEDTLKAVRMYDSSMDVMWYLESSMDWYAHLVRNSLTPASVAESVSFTLSALGDFHDLPK